MQRPIYLLTVLILIASLLLSACGGTSQGAEAASMPVTQAQAADPATQSGDESEPEAGRPAGWTEETHGKLADPNYDVVFPQDEVNRIDITIDAEDWQAMLDDMTALYGEAGSQPVMGQPGARPPLGGGDRPMPPPGQAPPDGFAPPEGMAPPNGMGPGAGGPLDSDENPIWVTANIEFESDTWTNVGIRFKGNSSLMQSWAAGNMKLPFKLDFDQFEDAYPEIEDQRFYGFKQLTFSSNFSDESFLREKVTADIFREAGLAAPQTSFYQVYVDYGDGPVYFGLYTMVEVVDDTVIETQFDDDSGNVYKPEGSGATFAEGSFSEASFDKETNQGEADYSDILALYEALHSDLRLSDPVIWRSQLESVFDVDTFLHWLAVNTVVQNWDTYGVMSHNYYLYNDPSTGLLTWIPWDNNMALRDDIGHGDVLSLDMSNVGDDWPLIRYLIDDEVYRRSYTAYVQETVENAFSPEQMEATYRELQELIEPYVVGEAGEIEGHTFLSSDSAFETALDDLIDHAYQRYQAATAYVLEQSTAD